MREERDQRELAEILGELEGMASELAFLEARIRRLVRHDAVAVARMVATRTRIRKRVDQLRLRLEDAGTP